jgi:hypothetical protein
LRSGFRTTTFPNQALKLNVIASIASLLRDFFKEVPQVFKVKSHFDHSNFPENHKIQKITPEIPICVAFLLKAGYNFVNIEK